MVGNNEFHEIGKLVGLREDEIKTTLPKKWFYLIFAIFMVLLLVLITIYGILVVPNYFDPYLQGTQYGAIEPRFLKRIRNKVSRYKVDF